MRTLLRDCFFNNWINSMEIVAATKMHDGEESARVAMSYTLNLLRPHVIEIPEWFTDTVAYKAAAAADVPLGEIVFLILLGRILPASLCRAFVAVVVYKLRMKSPVGVLFLLQNPFFPSQWLNLWGGGDSFFSAVWATKRNVEEEENHSRRSQFISNSYWKILCRRESIKNIGSLTQPSHRILNLTTAAGTIGSMEF